MDILYIINPLVAKNLIFLDYKGFFGQIKIRNGEAEMKSPNSYSDNDITSCKKMKNKPKSFI
jgi:hypothetical protein